VIAAAPSTAPPPHRGRILVADADPPALTATAFALSLAGFDVTTVASVTEVVSALETKTADVLLIDLEMPGNENCELVQTLNAKRCLVPIVVLTALPTLDMAVSAMRLGVVDYIAKPPAIDELSLRLEVAVHRARLLRTVEETGTLAGELARRLDTLRAVLRHGSPVPSGPVGEEATPALEFDPLRNLAPAELARLTPRERGVLRELAKGHTPTAMAHSLGLSTNTIRNHLKSMFVKLGVNSQVALLGKLTSPSR
jgi:FixJ family two-component response regulator